MLAVCRVVCLAAVMLLGMEARAASPGQLPRPRTPFPAIDVERGLVMPKGWTEVSLNYAVKHADLGGGEWTRRTGTMEVRWGATRRDEFALMLPVERQDCTLEGAGTGSASGLGDVRAGWKRTLTAARPPVRVLISRFEVQLPSGTQIDAERLYIRSIDRVVTLTTGTPSILAAIDGKQQLGPFAFVASVGGIGRLEGVTRFDIVDPDGAVWDRFRPGSSVRVGLTPMLQIGPIALRVAIVADWHGAAFVGKSSGGYLSARTKIQNSPGWWIVAQPKLSLNLTRGVDLAVAVAVPVRAGPVVFFALEELNPIHGNEWSFQMNMRF